MGSNCVLVNSKNTIVFGFKSRMGNQASGLLQYFCLDNFKENVYVSLLEGFELERREESRNSYALKLNKSLYGLVQSSIY